MARARGRRRGARALAPVARLGRRRGRSDGGLPARPGDPIKLPTATRPHLRGGARDARPPLRALHLRRAEPRREAAHRRLRLDRLERQRSGLGGGRHRRRAARRPPSCAPGGAIYVADPPASAPTDHLQAGASFQSNGPLAMLSSNADLLADAYVNGDVTGSVNVSGTLHVPATATVGTDVQAKRVVTGRRLGPAAVRLRRRDSSTWQARSRRRPPATATRRPVSAAGALATVSTTTQLSISAVGRTIWRPSAPPRRSRWRSTGTRCWRSRGA